jgi:hypothetical protein
MRPRRNPSRIGVRDARKEMARRQDRSRRRVLRGSGSGLPGASGPARAVHAACRHRSGRASPEPAHRAPAPVDGKARQRVGLMPWKFAGSRRSLSGAPENAARARTPPVPPRMNATTTHQKEISINRSSIRRIAGYCCGTPVFPPVDHASPTRLQTRQRGRTPESAACNHFEQQPCPDGDDCFPGRRTAQLGPPASVRALPWTQRWLRREHSSTDTRRPAPCAALPGPRSWPLPAGRWRPDVTKAVRPVPRVAGVPSCWFVEGS